MDRFVPQLLYFWHDPKGLDEGFRHLGVLLVILTTGSTTPHESYATGVALIRQTSLTTCREIVGYDNSYSQESSHRHLRYVAYATVYVPLSREVNWVFCKVLMLYLSIFEL